MGDLRSLALRFLSFRPDRTTQNKRCVVAGSVQLLLVTASIRVPLLRPTTCRVTLSSEYSGADAHAGWQRHCLEFRAQINSAVKSFYDKFH